MRARTIVALLLLFGALPFAAATNHVATGGEEIQGRAILFDLTRFDPDLAAVAGHATGTVSWFNGAIAFQREMDGWVYAAPAGTPDPAEKRLTPTGTWYNFTDHNGATWHVAEWTYTDAHELQYRLGDQIATERMALQVHVWTVRVAGDAIRDATLDLDYNFVTVIDTTKLGVTPVDEHGRATDDPFHPNGENAGAHNVDLHFSRADPQSLCLTC